MARDQRRELARCKFVSIDDNDLSCHSGTKHLGVQSCHWPKRNAKHEVQIDLELVRRASGVHEGQAPLASSVFARHALHRESLTRADRLDRLFHLRLVGEHRVAVPRANVVEIDVH